MATFEDINQEIDRIEEAKGGIKQAIEEKGVVVPTDSRIEDYPGYVRQIQQGEPDAVLFTPQVLTTEQQAQARENISAGTYTKPGNGIPASDLSQDVRNKLEKADTSLQPADLEPITDLIPEQASPQNQLADKNFVNSSVATNTANYISDNGEPFQSLADLEAYSGPLTNNDYAFVVGTDSAGNTTYTRYKYNATTGQWAEEYVLNNSSFTAAQWAAISSGITALLVQKLVDLPTNVVTYVVQVLTDAQKQQARTNIGAGTYSKPTTGIPEEDIAPGVIPSCPLINSLPASGGLLANSVYDVGTLTGNVNITLDTGSQLSGQVNIYVLCFTAGTPAPNIVFPLSITKWAGNCVDPTTGNPVISDGKDYEISIQGNRAIITEFA